MEIVDAIPVQYRVKTEVGGNIEKISYTTKDYFGDGGEITKDAFVYLPSGYDGTKQYGVLYLMHGIGGDEAVVVAVKLTDDGMRNAEHGIGERAFDLEPIALAKDAGRRGVVDIELLGGLRGEDVKAGVAVGVLVAQKPHPEVVAFGCEPYHPLGGLHQEVHSVRAVVGRVDRGDRGYLVGVAVTCEPSRFEAALGMCENVDFGCAGQAEDFV